MEGEDVDNKEKEKKKKRKRRAKTGGRAEEDQRYLLSLIKLLLDFIS